MPGTAQSQHSHQTRHQSFNTGPQSIIESSATSSVSDNPPEIYSLSHATDYTQREWHADTLRQGDGSMLEGMAATRDFHQRLPHEFAIDSSSHWQSWPTSEASSFVGEQFSPTPEPVHMMDRPKMITDQMLRAPSHHDAVFDPADDKLNDQRSQLDHPRAIRIQGSSGRYQPDLTSTFPPTADRFPDYREVSHKQRQNHATIASQSVNISRSASKVQLGRKNSSRTPSARSSTSGSMVIIRENVHKSPSISRTISMKGKRNGPLSPATAQAAAQKRKEKNVCIRYVIIPTMSVYIENRSE